MDMNKAGIHQAVTENEPTVRKVSALVQRINELEKALEKADNRSSFSFNLNSVLLIVLILHLPIFTQWATYWLGLFN